MLLWRIKCAKFREDILSNNIISIHEFDLERLVCLAAKSYSGLIWAIPTKELLRHISKTEELVLVRTDIRKDRASWLIDSAQF